MKAIKALSLTSAALVAALVAGCDNKPATAPMPEVNDENCKPENIAKIEDSIRAKIETVNQNLNTAIDGAEVLFTAHGITSTATYDTVPLDVDVHVLSSIGRRFLELLGKLDQLMPLLQTLEIQT